jgi:phasin family protein
MAENKKQSAHAANEEARKRDESAAHPAADMFKAFSQGKSPFFDRDTVIGNHRNNLEAINDANKMAIEVMKSISTLQTQYIRQTFEDFNSMLRELSTTPPSPENWKNQASRMKDSVSKAIDHSSNMANIVVKSNTDIYNQMQNRMNDSFEELKLNKQNKYKN